MTIEEMQNALETACRTHRPYCYSNGRCPLYGREGSCYSDSADIARNYAIVFGNKSEQNEPVPEKEAVNHPAHYQGKHECIDEMIALFGVEAVKHFCMCNVYKYRYRAANKNGQEDLDKADWYMDKLMELEGNHD
jgi:hypothetical protein